ncbi:hypothetical protein IKQ19_18805, partial [Candidatus Saccharibacteria bacterium]|nr:hypothetical protein [Candidatus Saccharibacteria bacterium]
MEKSSYYIYSREISNYRKKHHSAGAKKFTKEPTFCFFERISPIKVVNPVRIILQKIAQYRDQIWFAEKGKPHEATVLKRLSEIEMSDEGEFRKVRRDRIFEKDYFDKKYGALPE